MWQIGTHKTPSGEKQDNWEHNKPPSDEKQDSLEHIKPPSDEGGGKTKFWRRERKRQKLKRCSKTSLPQPRWCSAAPSSEGAEGIEKLTDLHKKQDNKHIQKLRYLVAICHYVKPPSDEGGGKTKVLTEGEKEAKA